MARANRALDSVKGFIGDLEIGTTDAENRAAQAGLKRARQDFIEHVDRAMQADPAQVGTLNRLQGRTIGRSFNLPRGTRRKS